MNKATEVWKKAQKDSDQIAQVIRSILLSEELQQNLSSKIKRPNILITSLVRCTNADAVPNGELFWWLRQMGYYQFSWAPPTGHPDDSAYWLNTDMMLKRWNTVPVLMVADLQEGGLIAKSATSQSPESLDTPGKLIDFWSKRVLGKAPSEDIRQKIENILMGDMEGAKIPYVREHHPDGFEFKLRQMISLLAMSPDFQRR